MTQGISRGDNCVICVEICEISRETWGLNVIDDLSEMIGWMKERREVLAGDALVQPQRHLAVKRLAMRRENS